MIVRRRVPARLQLPAIANCHRTARPPVLRLELSFKVPEARSKTGGVGKTFDFSFAVRPNNQQVFFVRVIESGLDL